MQLMNIKYKCVEDFGAENFPSMIIDWVKNTDDLRYRMDFVEKEFNGSSIYKDGNKELKIINYPEVNTIAAVHTDKDVYGVTWYLSVLFKPETHDMYIRMKNSKTSEDGYNKWKYSKPDILNELVEIGIIDMDYDIPMYFDYHNVAKGSTQEFLSILNRTARFTLPIIYFALGPYNTYGTDPVEIAERTAGMAHVFCQDHKNCFEELIEGTSHYVPKNGEVAIYYPDQNTKEQHFRFNDFNEKEMTNIIINSIHQYYRDKNYGPLTTLEEITSNVVEMRNSELKQENQKINLENIRIAEESNDMIQEFDDDMQATVRENEILKRRLAELERENELLRKKAQCADRIPVLYYGNEKELYEGEIKDILIDILENNVSVPKDSRRADIVTDLLKANSHTPELDERHQMVKSAFVGYRTLTPTSRRLLENVGFSITSDGKHHKLSYCMDPRYQISIAKTSSDCQSGRNAASKIIQFMM